MDYVEQRWVDGRRTVDFVRRAFRRVAAAAVLLFPGALVCALAGSTGMRPARFVSLDLIGSLLTVVALRVLADAVAGPLQKIVGFNDRNAGWLTALFVVATAAWLYWRRRNPRGGARGYAPDDQGDPAE